MKFVPYDYKPQNQTPQPHRSYSNLMMISNQCSLSNGSSTVLSFLHNIQPTQKQKSRHGGFYHLIKYFGKHLIIHLASAGENTSNLTMHFIFSTSQIKKSTMELLLHIPSCHILNKYFINLIHTLNQLPLTMKRLSVFLENISSTHCKGFHKLVFSFCDLPSGLQAIFILNFMGQNIFQSDYSCILSLNQSSSNHDSSYHFFLPSIFNGFHTLAIFNMYLQSLLGGHGRKNMTKHYIQRKGLIMKQ